MQRVEVAERLHLEVRARAPRRGRRSSSMRRHDDQRARAGRQAVLEVEADEPARADAGGDQALHERGRELARRQEREQRRRKDEPDRAAVAHTRTRRRRPCRRRSGPRGRRGRSAVAWRERGGVHARVDQAGTRGKPAWNACRLVPIRCSPTCARRASAPLVVRGLARRLDGALGDRDLVLAPRARERLDDRAGSGRADRKSMRPWMPAGSRCRTCSTRLARSKYSRQSLGRAEPEARERRSATETCAVAWRCGLVRGCRARPSVRAGRGARRARSEARDRRAVLARGAGPAARRRRRSGCREAPGKPSPSCAASIRRTKAVASAARARRPASHRSSDGDGSRSASFKHARPRPQLADAERRRRLKGGEVAGRRAPPRAAPRCAPAGPRRGLDAGAVVAARGSR